MVSSRIREQASHVLKTTESPLNEIARSKSARETDRDERIAYRRNILLMKRSLLMGFLFLPFGCSVHICRSHAMSARRHLTPFQSRLYLLHILKYLHKAQHGSAQLKSGAVVTDHITVPIERLDPRE